MGYCLKARLFDLTFASWLARLLGFAAYTGSLVSGLFSPRLSARLLSLASYSLTRSAAFPLETSRLGRTIEGTLRKQAAAGGPITTMASGTSLFETNLSESLRIAGLVLKAPRRIDGRTIERGVLAFRNEGRARMALDRLETRTLLDDYALVVGTSWSGLGGNSDILHLTRLSPHRVVVTTAEKRDQRWLVELHSNLISLPIADGHWVHPGIFRPLQLEKRFGAVMVARWTVTKRHHVLMRALRELDDPSFEVALVARRFRVDRDERGILALARSYGVESQLRVFCDLTAEGVNEVLNQSKVNLLLSLQEGGNRSLAEGFFAGVPGVALRRNIGLDKEFLNPATGRLIDDEDLAETLRFFADRWQDFNPRPWAEKHLAPAVTTARLNVLLRRLAEGRGEPWTVDIVTSCSTPRPAYYPEASAGQHLPDLAALLAAYALK